MFAIGARWCRIGTRRWTVLAWLVVGWLGGAAAVGQIANPGFELPREDGYDGVPAAWRVPGSGYGVTRTREESPPEGQWCAMLARGEGGGRSSPFGNLMQTIDAQSFRGKVMDFSAMIKLAKPAADARVQMWVRVDRENGEQGFFDNMGDRPIKSDTWARYTISGAIDADASEINIGFMLIGTSGVAVIDDVRMAPAATTPAAAKKAGGPLSARGLENEVALARLMGYVRFFHPSSESQGIDWDAFAVAGIDRVEAAADAAALAKTLTELFVPIAPTVQVWAGAADAVPEASVMATGGKRLVGYDHYGVALGPTKPDGLYRSTRVVERPEVERTKSKIMPAGTAVVKDLGGGVCCRVPVTLEADADGRSLPRGQLASVPKPERPDGWRPAADDRSSRLAAVMLAWNIAQHFYPYFDRVEIDWPAALRAALTKAATDTDAAELQLTLRVLVATLRDGHGNVRSSQVKKRPVLPLRLTWVGDGLVALAECAGNPEPIKPGDQIVSINGRSVGEKYAEIGPRVSAATEQFRRYRATMEIIAVDESVPVQVVVRSPAGAEREVQVTPQDVSALVVNGKLPELPKRPANGAEVAAGVVYFNLVGATDEELANHIKALAAAKGVIFDLRGYPDSAGATVLGHLVSKPERSLQMFVPVVRMPDREGMTFDQVPPWPIAPSEPHIGGRVVFVTDASAISYAESVMSIVESLKLGAIVGGATAGTNGNVNPLSLPCGFTMVWTGMKVTKDDGSPHHGIGIKPGTSVEATAAGIAAGRDEVLEKAIEVAREPAGR